MNKNHRSIIMLEVYKLLYGSISLSFSQVTHKCFLNTLLFKNKMSRKAATYLVSAKITHNLDTDTCCQNLSESS